MALGQNDQSPNTERKCMQMLEMFTTMLLLRIKNVFHSRSHLIACNCFPSHFAGSFRKFHNILVISLKKESILSVVYHFCLSFSEEKRPQHSLLEKISVCVCVCVGTLELN